MPSIYPILSRNVYRGKPSDTAKILPEKIKSMIEDKITVGSYGNAPSTQIFTKEGIAMRTANNRFVISYEDYKKNGYASPQIDDGVTRGSYKFPSFDNWRSAGEDVKPNMFNIIPTMPDFALIVSPRLGMYFSNEGDTKVNLRTSHDIVNAIYPNHLGRAYSKIANMEQTLREMVIQRREHYPEAAEYIKFLAKEGFPIEEAANKIIGLGIEKGDFHAAYYPQGYLVAGFDFHSMAENLMRRYGLTERDAVEAMERSVLLHELGHTVVKSEKLQGLLQAKFYSMMAENYKGTKIERIYRTLAKEGIDYAREHEHSLADKIIEIISGNASEHNAEIRMIEHKFLKEAFELGVEDIEGYVDMRMEETLGAILVGEPSYKSRSYKNSRTSKKPKPEDRNLKSLEKILDESVGSFAIEEITAPTYEGKRVYGEGASMPAKLIRKGDKKESEGKSRIEAYEGRIDKSEYKSMEDVKDNEAKFEKGEMEASEITQEAETAEASAGGSN